MQTIFSGSESMHFSVSWTGGIKIGDLTLDLQVGGKQRLRHSCPGNRLRPVQAVLSGG